MTPTLSSPASLARRSTRRKTGSSSHADRAHTRQERGTRRKPRLLDRYTDWKGCSREVVAQPGLAGSVLVVDRDVVHRGDGRLVAHLAADEPAENAALVCERYLEEARGCRCRCRRLTPEDFLRAPFAEDWEAEPQAASVEIDAELSDQHGRSYRLGPLQTGLSIPELRWRQHPAKEADSGPRPVSVREAIASLESYEPVRAITLRTLALRSGDSEVSTTVLRAELERMQNSPIVLNRGLRMTVLATIERHELSMSEIAIRCGRIKRAGIALLMLSILCRSGCD